jgi:phytoene dehydrogenase-like protein
VLANHERWAALDEQAYRAEKQAVFGAMLDAAERFLPPVRAHTVYSDTFTPRTVEHFTGHRGGAVYGSPDKRSDGSTGVQGLYLCGTDQGLVGIVGALLSGITVANKYALVAQ